MQRIDPYKAFKARTGTNPKKQHLVVFVLAENTLEKMASLQRVKACGCCGSTESFGRIEQKCRDCPRVIRQECVIQCEGCADLLCQNCTEQR